jgi:uncharacterized protein (TIRG00374 family)
MSLKKSFIYSFLSILFALAMLAYIFLRIDLREVWDLIVSSDLFGVIMFVALSLFGSLCRTWRQSLILFVNGFKPSKVALFLTVLVRNLCADLLPGRIGSLVDVFITTTRLGVAANVALASWAQAYIFDLVAVVPLLALAAMISGSITNVSPALLTVGATILGTGFILLLKYLDKIFILSAKIIDGLAHKIPSRFENIAIKFASLLASSSKSIQETKQAKIYSRLLVLSIIIRIAKYASLYFFLFALLHPLGYQFSDLDPLKVVVGLLVAETAATLPISGVAGFGAYQGAWIFIFQLLGFPEKISQITSVAHHLFTQIYGYSLGIIAGLILALPVFKQTSAIPEKDN